LTVNSVTNPAGIITVNLSTGPALNIGQAVQFTSINSNAFPAIVLANTTYYIASYVIGETARGIMAISSSRYGPILVPP
jgi:hypothetical protein